MKEKNIYDPNLFDIFENGYDFYLYLVNKFDLKDDENETAEK